MDYFNWIKDRIDRFDVSQNICYAALTCEYILPNYLFFEKIENWGNFEFLREFLLFPFSKILSPRTAEDNLKLFYNEIYNAAPDLDDFGPSASYAFDTGVAFAELLQYLIDFNKEHIINVGAGSFGTVEMFVSQDKKLASSKPSTQTIVLEGIFMKREINRQENIIKEIAKISSFDLDQITYLRKANLETPLLPLDKIL